MRLSGIAGNFSLVAALAVAAAAGSWRGELKSLIKTERDFAGTSVAKGTKAAFLAYIADDGIVFRPGPVPGRKWLSEHPASPGTLDWRPEYADLSLAGDLGYTTGPYEFRGAQGSRHGHYVTLWKRQTDGTWKFAVDYGISHPPEEPPPAEWFPLKPVAPPGSALNPSKEVSVLLELEDEFEATAAEHGLATAYAAFSTADIRLYRDGHPPARGRRGMLDLLAGNAGTMTWKADRAEVSRSCDLGFTYGAFGLKPAGNTDKPATGYYMRIWKRFAHDSWKVALDILN